MSTEKRSKLPLSLKAGYGAAALASAVWIAYYSFFVLFLTTVVGMEPILAGLIGGIASLWDAITGPIIGTISDNAKFKGGRRRPFLIAIAVPFAIVAWLLFTDFNLSPGISFLYFTVVTMIFFTAYSFFDVPFSALGAEITQDYDERVTLNSSRLFYVQIACILGASISIMLVEYFTTLYGSEQIGWSLMGGILGLVCIPGFFITWRVTKGRELYDNREAVSSEKVKLTQMWKVAFSNRPLVYTLGMFSFGVCSITLWTAVTAYFYQFYMGFDLTMLAYVYLVSAIFGIPFIPFIDFLAKKYSKNLSWIVNCVIFGIFIVIGFIFVLKPGMIGASYLFAALTGGGQMVVYQIGYSMISDCVEVDELMSGQRREGIIYGFVTFIQKASTGVMMFLLGLVLQLVDFTGDGVQALGTIKGIIYLNGYGVGFFVLLSVLFAIFSPMTRKRHKDLCNIIALKNAGKPYDLEPIKPLIGKRMLKKINN